MTGNRVAYTGAPGGRSALPQTVSGETANHKNDGVEDVGQLCLSNASVSTGVGQWAMSGGRWFIPAELRRSRRWVRCDCNEVPVSADGVALMWRSPQVWMSFEEACNATYGVGLGFVLDEGMAVCRVKRAFAESGDLTTLARISLESRVAGWVELDPTGQGLVLWGRCNPRQRRRARSDAQEFFCGRDIGCVPVSGDTFESGPVEKMRTGYFSRPGDDVPLCADLDIPASVTWIGTGDSM